MPLHQFSYSLAYQSRFTHIIEKDTQAPCDVACVIPINVDTGLIRSGWYDLRTPLAPTTIGFSIAIASRETIPKGLYGEGSAAMSHAV